MSRPATRRARAAQALHAAIAPASLALALLTPACAPPLSSLQAAPASPVAPAASAGPHGPQAAVMPLGLHAATVPHPGHPSPAPRQEIIVGRALRVQDGDSFVMQAADGRRITVRIAGIDAPEKGQPFADRARRHLAELMQRGELTLTPLKTDPFGRVVADVRLDGSDGPDVGLALVRAGLAWHFRRYASDQTPAQRRAYSQAEARAREEGLGLWSQRDPVPPWQHRDRQRRASGPSS